MSVMSNDKELLILESLVLILNELRNLRETVLPSDDFTCFQSIDNRLLKLRGLIEVDEDDRQCSNCKYIYEDSSLGACDECIGLSAWTLKR